MTGADFGPPAADPEAVAASLARLKRDREGVAMYLILEDLADDGPAAAESGPEGNGGALAALAAYYGQRMLVRDDPPEKEVAAVLEVLAAAHFTEARA
jgi:hypothetical protein